MGSLTPRGAFGRSPPVRGFTLVEILVTLAIVALASGAAWLAWRGGGDTSLRREATRFAGAVEYAAQRAQWRHEDLGVSAGDGGWRFWRRDRERNAWIPLVDDDVLAARALPSGIRLAAASYAGRAVESDALVPLRASGRNDPATFVLDAEGRRLRVDTDPLNRAVVTADEP